MGMIQTSESGWSVCVWEGGRGVFECGNLSECASSATVALSHIQALAQNRRTASILKNYIQPHFAWSRTVS